MTTEKDWESGREKVPWWTSWRLALAIIGFFGFVNIYAQRVGMSVAIVCMVNQTAVRMIGHQVELNVSENGHDGVVAYNLTQDDDLHTGPQCAMQTVKGEEKFLDGVFVWDKTLQGHILGSFFYGYLVSQVPGGMLAERYGGKWVFAVFTLLGTLATLFTPMAARISHYFLIGLRVLAGIGSGAAFPAMHVMWMQWAPPNERAKLTNITYAGAWMGNVISLPLAGILCKYGFDGGWPSIFYVIGASSALWLILWCALVSDSPATHKRISAVEREYITNSLKGYISANDKKHQLPWCKALTSMPVWAIVVGGITCDWGLYTFLTNIPTYLYEVLKFDIQSNGLYSALPFIGLWVNMNVSPIVADKLISSGTLSTGATRKVMHSFGAFGAAAIVIGLAFVDCSHALVAVALLTVGITITASVYSGYMINPMDIAPRFAGTILGVANGIAAATGFVAPYTVASLTTNRTHEEWQSVFFLSAAIYTFGALFYIVFGSGEVQEWAKCENEEGTEDEKVELNSNGEIATPIVKGPPKLIINGDANTTDTRA